MREELGMFYFDCAIDFQSHLPFDELAHELSMRYFAGLRFIPADRRDAREFTRAEFTEYPVINHDVDLIWDEGLEGFRLCVLKGANEEWLANAESCLEMQPGSFARCLGVLLRQIDGVHSIRVNPNTAGPYLDVWQARVRFNSRRTVQEVGAILTQKLFCGFRFVPASGASMRSAVSFRTEHNLLGHQIELNYDSMLGHHILSIEPSSALLDQLTLDERRILRGLDISNWIKAPFLLHPWVRPSSFAEDEPPSDNETGKPA